MKRITSILGVLLLVLLAASCSEPDGLNDPDGGQMAKKPGTTVILPQINANQSSSSGEIGDEITIIGTDFDNVQKSGSVVTINGVAGTVYSKWSKTEIRVLVPSGSVNDDYPNIPGLQGKLSVTNSKGTSNEINFTIAPSSEVTIGSQVWMGANFDGDVIYNNQVLPATTDANDWIQKAANGEPAWCYLLNGEDWGIRFGKLYNWYALQYLDLPAGWHVPTDADFIELAKALGMSEADANAFGDGYGTDEGGKLKEMGNSMWCIPNEGATNSSGFVGLPGAMRSSIDGTFKSFDILYGGKYYGYYGYFWSTTTYPSELQDYAYIRWLYKHDARFTRYAYRKGHGLSVRLVKDTPPSQQ